MWFLHGSREENLTPANPPSMGSDITTFPEWSQTITAAEQQLPTPSLLPRQAILANSITKMANGNSQTENQSTTAQAPPAPCSASHLRTKYMSTSGRKNVVPNKTALDNAVSLTACRERAKQVLSKQCSGQLQTLPASLSAFFVEHSGV